MNPDALAALCADAMPEERLTSTELARLCFGVNDHGDADELIGDERGAAVMQLQRFGKHTAAWLVLLAVHPAHQSRGLLPQPVRAFLEGWLGVM